MSAHVQATDFSAEDFFAQQPPPPGLDAHLSQVKDFVERNASQGRKVVLVTVRQCITVVSTPTRWLPRTVWSVPAAVELSVLPPPHRFTEWRHYRPAGT